MMAHYDGNGNVRSLVDRATGVQTAAYAYSASGETIRASGAAASTNPVRFSTKLQRLPHARQAGLRECLPQPSKAICSFHLTFFGLTRMALS